MRVLSGALLTAAFLMPPAGWASGDHATVLVVRHRWHTGVVLPADRVAPQLAFLEEEFVDAAWYEIGWGDNDFYRRPDSLWLMAKALFWPTRGVLHVVALDRHPAALPHSDVKALCLDAEGLGQLREALAADFRLDDRHRPVSASPGLYGDSRFFPARGRFWFGRTCNTWTAQRLKQGGVGIRAFMTLTADSVMAQIRQTGRAGACPDAS